MRNLLPGRYARRLALAFAALGIGSALLTAVLVNTAFTVRFHDYMGEQQSLEQQQLVSMFAAGYAANKAWNPRSLNRLAPGVIMTGSEAELLDATGQRMWSLADADTDADMPAYAGTPAMHRAIMGTGELGPPRSLPVVVDGDLVGTLVVRVPQGEIPTVDNEFRASVNRLLAPALSPQRWSPCSSASTPPAVPPLPSPNLPVPQTISPPGTATGASPPHQTTK